MKNKGVCRQFLLLALILFSCPVSGQSVQVLLGKTPKIFIEGQRATDKVFQYAYIEGSKDGAYVQLIHEQNLWNQLSLHIEGRTTFQGWNSCVGIVGPCWTFFPNKGTISVQPLFRYDGTGANWQASCVYSFDWSWSNLYGYLDVWGKTSPQVFSEIRYYIKICEHFYLGCVLDLMYFEKFDIVPYGGIRFDF